MFASKNSRLFSAAACSSSGDLTKRNCDIIPPM
jgi:hypothetical protein